MILYPGENSWNTVRLDKRNYTAQKAKEQQKELIKRIPEQYIYIDDRCFRNAGRMKEVENHSLRQVIFPPSVKYIGTQCYRECNNLRIAKFEKNSKCTIIPEGMFDSCVRLYKVILPQKTQEIERRAFYRCKELKKITFPNTLRKIGDEAFYFCGFEELHLPDKLEEIGDSAFFRCSSLKYVFIPKSVKSIDRWVFHGCSKLEYLEIHHDPEYIGPWIVNKSCTIRCYKGSKMDRYCDEFELKREYISAKSIIDK